MAKAWRVTSELDWRAGGRDFFGEVAVEEDGDKVSRTRLEINGRGENGCWQTLLDVTAQGNNAYTYEARLAGYAEGMQYALDGLRQDAGSDGR